MMRKMMFTIAASIMFDSNASGQVFIYHSPDTDFPWKQKPATFIPRYRFGRVY